MTDNIFLYTLPQWFVFSAITIIVYGWAEKKKPFRLVGLLVFVLLGIYAAWAIHKGYFLSAKFLTPDELFYEEMNDELIEEMPFEGKLFPAYWSFVISGILALPAIFLDWKDKKPNRLIIILTGLVALFGFFVIVDALRFL